MSKYGVFSGPCISVFGLYTVNLRIQSEYRKIRTRKNSVFGRFSQSGGICLEVGSKGVTEVNGEEYKLSFYPHFTHEEFTFSAC